MNHRQKVVAACKEVFSQPKYVAIALLATVILASLNLLITNYQLILNNFSLTLLYSLTIIALVNGPLFTSSILLSTSLLAGMVFSMSLFIMAKQLRAGLGAGSTVLVSVLLPSCPSCALGPLTALGLGGLLAFLPFNGLELSFAAIVLLMVTIVYLSNKITAKVCKV